MYFVDLESLRGEKARYDKAHKDAAARRRKDNAAWNKAHKNDKRKGK